MSTHDIINNCHQKLADNIKWRNLFRNAVFILVLVALASICGRPPDRQVIPASFLQAVTRGTGLNVESWISLFRPEIGNVSLDFHICQIISFFCRTSRFRD